MTSKHWLSCVNTSVTEQENNACSDAFWNCGPKNKISGSESFTRWLAPGSELGASWEQAGTSWSEGSEMNVILGFRVPTTIGLRKPPAGSPCSQLVPLAPRASLGPWSLWGARGYGQGGSKLAPSLLPASQLTPACSSSLPAFSSLLPLLQLAPSSLQPPSSLQLIPLLKLAPSSIQSPSSLQLAPSSIQSPSSLQLAPSSLQPPSSLQLAPSSLQPPSLLHLLQLTPSCLQPPSLLPCSSSLPALSSLPAHSQLAPAHSPRSSSLPACSPHSSSLPLLQLAPSSLQLTPLTPSLLSIIKSV